MSPNTPVPPSIDKAWFRRVLGQYPTGVVVVTAADSDDKPAGMAVGSFTSVSLDPPLVAFLPDKSSSSWPRIEAAGRFCANILGAHQEPVCRAFAAKGVDKFEGLKWRLSEFGSPILEDVVAWIDCDIEVVHDAGDHYIVIGRVRSLDIERQGLPLLFFQGGYGRFSPLSMAAADADLLDQLRLVDLARGEMEAVAAELDLECIASALVGDELVLVASAGEPRAGELPTRVGQRLPFGPPLGTLWAAWTEPAVTERWLTAFGAGESSEREACERLLERVRERGYSLGIGTNGHAELERALAEHTTRPSVEAVEVIRALTRRLGHQYEAAGLEPGESRDVRAIAAPVFGSDGTVALVLSLYGLPPLSTAEEVRRLVDRVMRAAGAVTEVIGGQPPVGS